MAMTVGGDGEPLWSAAAMKRELRRLQAEVERLRARAEAAEQQAQRARRDAESAWRLMRELSGR
jgi:hypothetical protein